ncbi:MAG: phosphoribosylaminoimidazolesuccinocarboxamide synthase [Phycisphaeraceae bacterium]|nr:MAG: phosphoribosylaminoimidazolesuccinocarboxamide synthase [Phycisphaeraceae bacterium]
MGTILETHLPLPGRRAGKVRDIYDLPPDAEGRERLLIVATDRLSAFDVVLPTPIPDKGRILTALSSRWFRWIEERGLAKTHLLSTDVDTLVQEGVLTPGDARQLAGRVTIARRCRVAPVECVARGYLDGSGWKEYEATGRVCGIGLPSGLRRGDRLPEPIFTPATKAEQGAHDENITFDDAAAAVGAAVMEQLRAMTLAIYEAAHAYALERGVILADTKFEFGVVEDGVNRGAMLLCDEALTPDSSRYWEASAWSPGGAQESYDKQFVREYLEGLARGGAWDKRAPGPVLPAEVVEGTRERYARAAARLFGI